MNNDVKVGVARRHLAIMIVIATSLGLGLWMWTSILRRCPVSSGNQSSPDTKNWTEWTTADSGIINSGQVSERTKASQPDSIDGRAGQLSEEASGSNRTGTSWDMSKAGGYLEFAAQFVHKLVRPDDWTHVLGRKVRISKPNLSLSRDTFGAQLNIVQWIDAPLGTAIVISVDSIVVDMNWIMETEGTYADLIASGVGRFHRMTVQLDPAAGQNNATIGTVWCPVSGYSHPTIFIGNGNIKVKIVIKQHQGVPNHDAIIDYAKLVAQRIDKVAGVMMSELSDCKLWPIEAR